MDLGKPIREHDVLPAEEPVPAKDVPDVPAEEPAQEPVEEPIGV